MEIVFYRNLITAQLNAQNAHSRIIDIDFSKETIIFAKMKALVQSGAFSPLAQAIHGEEAVSFHPTVIQTPKGLTC